MKNRRKSIVRKIWAVLAVVIIISTMCLTCFAQTGDMHTISMFIYTEYVADGFNVTENQPGTEFTYWGVPISYGQLSTIYNSVNNQNESILETNYESYMNIRIPMTTNLLANNIQNQDFTMYSYSPNYDIICTNMLIDTETDDFILNIETDYSIDYTITCSYTILDGENKGTEKELIIDDDISTGTNDLYYLNFNLEDNIIESEMGNYTLVLVNELVIQLSSINEIYNNSNTTIDWILNESLIERNTNYFGELNYYNTVSTAFEEIGIANYNETFEEYSTDFTSWLGTAVGGFLNMELFPYFSIGGILLICVSIGLVSYFLKVFLGG